VCESQAACHIQRTWQPSVVAPVHGLLCAVRVLACEGSGRADQKWPSSAPAAILVHSRRQPFSTCPADQCAGRVCCSATNAAAQARARQEQDAHARSAPPQPPLTEPALPALRAQQPRGVLQQQLPRGPALDQVSQVVHHLRDALRLQEQPRLAHEPGGVRGGGAEAPGRSVVGRSAGSCCLGARSCCLWAASCCLRVIGSPNWAGYWAGAAGARCRPSSPPCAAGGCLRAVREQHAASRFEHRRSCGPARTPPVSPCRQPLTTKPARRQSAASP
jgi:hypothetical protein